MKLKRIIALSLSAATLALSLTACGGSSSAASDNAQASDSNSGDAVTVKLGVVGSIYEDLWTPAKEALKNGEKVEDTTYLSDKEKIKEARRRYAEKYGDEYIDD